MDLIQPMNRTTLDLLRVASQHRTSRMALQKMEIREWADQVADQLVHSLEGYVLAEKLVSEVCEGRIQVPATWWQHFKLTNCYLNLDKDRIMRWASRKWPVKYEKKVVKARFDRYATFPSATMQVSELGRPVIFEQWAPYD